MDKKIPKEHKPYDQKIVCPIRCPECDGEMYCIAIYCGCKKHEGDFELNKDTDGFKFFCKLCYKTVELSVSKTYPNGDCPI